MKIIILRPDQPPEERVVDDANPVKAAREIINDTLDFTKVIYNGKRCTMAVGDTSTIDGLPHNAEATKAYHAACIPGTTWPICGTTVVFDGLLP